MKTQNGFTLIDKSEIASYLAKQKVTRKITRLQVQLVKQQIGLILVVRHFNLFQEGK